MPRQVMDAMRRARMLIRTGITLSRQRNTVGYGFACCMPEHASASGTVCEGPWRRERMVCWHTRASVQGRPGREKTRLDAAGLRSVVFTELFPDHAAALCGTAYLRPGMAQLPGKQAL